MKKKIELQSHDNKSFVFYSRLCLWRPGTSRHFTPISIVLPLICVSVFHGPRDWTSGRVIHKRGNVEGTIIWDYRHVSPGLAPFSYIYVCICMCVCVVCHYISPLYKWPLIYFRELYKIRIVLSSLEPYGNLVKCM